MSIDAPAAPRSCPNRGARQSTSVQTAHPSSPRDGTNVRAARRLDRAVERKQQLAGSTCGAEVAADRLSTTQSANVVASSTTQRFPRTRDAVAGRNCTPCRRAMVMPGDSATDELWDLSRLRALKDRNSCPQVRIRIVKKFHYERMLFESSLDDASLDAAAATVDRAAPRGGPQRAPR